MGKFKPYTQKKDSKKKSKTQGVRATFWPPEWVLKAIDIRAVEEDCSRTWWIVEACCEKLGIEESQIAEERGYEIPKKMIDRANDKEWSPNTKASQKASKKKSTGNTQRKQKREEDYFNDAAKEEGTSLISDGAHEFLMKKCITPGCEGGLMLVKGDEDIPYWEAGLCEDCGG